MVAASACEESKPAATAAVATPTAPKPAVATPPVAPTAPTPAPVVEPGTWYRAHLVFDGVGELPFFLHIPLPGTNGKAIVINGDETADFQAEWRDNEISITGPWAYVSVIEADSRRARTSSRVRGRARRRCGARSCARSRRCRSIASIRARGFRIPTPNAKPVDIAGTWKFQFAEHGVGKGAFVQGADGVVRGYVKPGQLGDIRFLAGNERGTKLSLSTFNGNSANLVLADVSADGTTMTGLMSMQNVWNEKFTAKKVPNFDFENKVHLKDGKQTVSLRGLDKYKGKPTLAIIFATWCSSCNDAYPVFKQLYAKYHPQGLEVFGVAYDLTEDEKANQVQLDGFRAKHQIPWELLQVPCTPETWAKAMPPELEGWDGLPIILLVRPDGTVQTVFGGWFGPATGADGARLQAWFEEQTKALVEAAAKKPS